MSSYWGFIVLLSFNYLSDIMAILCFNLAYIIDRFTSILDNNQSLKVEEYFEDLTLFVES